MWTHTPYCLDGETLSCCQVRGFRRCVNHNDHDRRKPLHHAASRGNAHTMKVLLDQGAATDAEDRDGEFPLHRVVKSIDNTNHRVQALRLLLCRGTDRLNESECSGCTALHVVGPKRYARNLVEYGGIQSGCPAKSVLIEINNLLSASVRLPYIK